MNKKSENDNTSKIPHIFHVIPSFAHGGVPIRISYLMNHFGKKAKHTLFSTNNDYACSSRLNEQVDITIPELNGVDQGGLINRLFKYRKVIKNIKPDLLLTYQWGSIEWAMANRFFPLCKHYHLESGFGPEEALSTLPRRNQFRQYALKNIEGIVVPSQTLIEICKSDWLIPEEKINYIPNGVDCEKYASKPKEGIIPGYKKEAGEITIGTMTPLRPEKNLPRLIHAFKSLLQNSSDKKFSLIIMGEGGERTHLEELIAELEIQEHVYLPGHIDEPASALGWLDVYAISSDTEQMPNSLNQAMAAGLPIVGLDVGDVMFMMNEENKKYIAPAGEDLTFTKMLIDMADNPVLIKEIGEINKKHVKETFDQSRMFESYAKIWNVI